MGFILACFMGNLHFFAMSILWYVFVSVLILYGIKTNQKPGLNIDFWTREHGMTFFPEVTSDLTTAKIYHGNSDGKSLVYHGMCCYQ